MENDVGVAVSTRPLDDGWYGYDLEHKKPVRLDNSPPSHRIGAIQILKRNLRFFCGCVDFAGTHQARSSNDGQRGWRPAYVQALSDLIPAAQFTFEFTVKGSVARRQRIDLTCADLLCPRIKLVEELLRDVGCVPRHGYHGADACSTCQLLVKWPHQCPRSYSIIH